MALDTAVRGISGVQQDVDANNAAVVRGPTNPANAGFMAIAGVDDSTVIAARAKRVQVTENGSLRIGQTNIFWDDTFNATALNTAKYKFFATTMAAAMAAGAITFNTGGITTVNTNAAVQTTRTFPLHGNVETRFTFSGGIVSGFPHVANNTIEFGAFTATLPGGAAPADGVFFRYNTANELRGVISYNGTETQTTAITAPSVGAIHDFLIIVQSNAISFVIDNIPRATITLTTDAPAFGQPFLQGAVPITIRQYIGAGAPASATKIQFTDVYVSLVGPAAVRPWAQTKAGLGHMASQGQNGGTMGSTANFGNGALAAATALSNTAVGTGNPAGLGGYAHYLPTLTAGTDGILVSYQNPAGGVNQTPRNLVITGVWVNSVVDVALTGGPLAMLYTLAYGHTAVSLATAETASFTSGGVKAPRRVPIGVEGCVVTAAAGTQLSQGGVFRAFASPIVIAPGEFVAVTARNVGTVTTLGSITAIVGFDAHYE